MDDREIVRLFLARDEAALKAAGEKYRSYLMKIAENITGSREDAEECLNDALLKAWETIPPMQPEMLSTYLGKLTRNLAINRRRQSDRAKRGSTPFEELSGMISGGETAERELDSKLLSESINDFLKRLSERKRSLFVRRYWYCESVKDAAAAEGMTESAASVTLHRLRDKLRVFLKQRGFEV